MGRPSNTEQRRREIVEATIRVMARSGYDGASVQAIAKEAGLSPGLLHHHFTRKQAILLAVLRHLEDVLEARYQVRARRRRSPWGRLEAWVEAHLAHGDDASPEAAAVWVWLGAQALRDDELRTRYAAVVQRRVETVTELIEAYAWAEGIRADVHACAVSTLAAVEGYFQLAITTAVVPAGSAADAVMGLLRRQLGGGAR